jgi:polysaccharide chain length determinant protein (PEP-CTERM system associated)
MKPPTADEFIQILWRRKLWLVIPLILGVVGGFTAIRLMPPKYKAAAEILIEPPKVAEGMVKRITNLSTKDRLEAVRRYITARERLEQLITDFDLYPDLGLNEALARVKKELVLKVSADESSKFRIVKIQLSGRNSERVAAAVNRVADDYVAQNSSLRDRESGGTASFAESQLIDSKRELEAIESQITEFKSANLMRLPDQRESHMRALESLQAKRAANDDAIEGAEMRLSLLRQGVRPAEPAGEAISPQAAQLEKLRQDLRALRRDFTDQHPDVIRLQRQVDALEEEVTRAPRARAVEKDVAEDPRLAAEIAQLQFKIGDLKNDQRQIEANASRYRSYLEQIPAVEQQLLILQREYENAKRFYTRNLEKMTEVGASQDLEKGELRATVSIFERAFPPAAPYSPNKPLVLMVAFTLGAAVGLGLALLAENISGGFEGPAELRRAFPGVRVLESIPRLRVAAVDIPPANVRRRSA